VGSRVERHRAGRNFLTPHGTEAYPGLRVVRPGEWSMALLVPGDGASFVARGGERLLGYTTVSGVRAESLTLQPGDRVRMVAWDLPASLVDWEVERLSDV